ncbi:hypothetical protein Tco_0300335 [Tanacetum coccineum]
MHDPCEPHLVALKQILRYVRILLIMLFNFMFPLPLSSLHTSMLIGKVVESPYSPLLEDKYQGIANVASETT